MTPTQPRPVGPSGGGGRGLIGPYTHTHIYVYSLIYTTLPNSRWLHHAALRYVGKVQLGAHMGRRRRNWVKMGSKWAHFTCLCTPNGLGSLLENALLTHF